MGKYARFSQFVSCMWLGAGALIETRARADEPSETVRLVYRAPALCPDEGAFFALVHARAPGVRRAATVATATTVDVAISMASTHFVGELVVRDPSGRSTTRSVSGGCEDVVSALALVAVLLLTPASPSPASPASPSPASPSPASPSPASPSPASPSPASPSPPVLPSGTRGGAASSRPERTKVAASLSRPSAWSVALQGDVLGLGAGPLVFRGGAMLRRRAFGAGFVSLGASAATSEVMAPGGTARATWITSMVEACPAGFAISRSLTVLPCVPLEAGMLTVGSAPVVNATSRSRGWLSVGVLMRLEHAIGDWLFADAHAGILAPFLRDTFYVRPDIDVYRPPAMVFQAGIAGGGRFP